MKIPVRPLTQQEQAWMTEILGGNPEWADISANSISVIEETVSGNSQTMKLFTEAPAKKKLSETKGYVGRLEIRTADNFGITVTLDQYNGLLDELYVDFLDLEEKGDRPRPLEWEELVHIYTSM
jgi:hypothetical protein